MFSRLWNRGAERLEVTAPKLRHTTTRSASDERGISLIAIQSLRTGGLSQESLRAVALYPALQGGFGRELSRTASCGRIGERESGTPQDCKKSVEENSRL